MLSAILVAVLIPVVVVYCIKNAYKRDKNFPPGPPSLPVYGAFPIIRALGGRDLSKACTKLCDYYKTKVLGFYLSIYPCVILNDPVLMKEMLVREGFDGRMDIIVARLRSYFKKLGIFFTDGYFWQIQRRFSFRLMRDYGFGRRDKSLEEVTAAEIKEIIDMRINGPKHPYEKEIIKGDLVYLHLFFLPPFVNAINHVFSQMTLPRSEYYKMRNVAKNVIMFMKGSDDFGGALSLTPSLKDIAPNWSGYNQMIKGNQVLMDYVTEMVEKEMKTHDESYDRHFLDCYIRLMKEELRNEGKSTFSEDQLRVLCMDYIMPSTTGPEGMLTMLIERLLIQPEIQDKVHEEIDRVVGRDKLPTLDDRQHMPYTEACIREIMRCDTLVPMGVPHRVLKDINFAGYDLPENTMIANNYYALHYDKKLWGDPENFRPERFITNGKLDLSKDHSLPFGAGRRLCPGETFSRQIMFQVFASFMQAFKVLPADGVQPKKTVPRNMGIVITMPEFWVRVLPRNSD